MNPRFCNAPGRIFFNYIMQFKFAVFSIWIFTSVTFAQSNSAIQPWYQNGVLGVDIPGDRIEKLISTELNKNLTGYQEDTDSKVAYVKKFRAKLDKGSVRITFDYQAKTRGWTHGIGGKWYGPWVEDSGWIEVRVFFGIRNDRLYAYTRNGYVRWKSNNWFTNSYIKGELDQRVRDNVAKEINEFAIRHLKTLNVKSILVNQGAPYVAAQLRVSVPQAQQIIQRSLANSPIQAQVFHDRMRISSNLMRPQAVVTLTNPTAQPVTYQLRFGPNERWQSFSLNSGRHQSNWNASLETMEIRYDSNLSAGVQTTWLRLHHRIVRILGTPKYSHGAWHRFNLKDGRLQLVRDSNQGLNSRREVLANYTIVNKSGKTVRFKMFPSMREYKVLPGRTFTGKSRDFGRPPRIKVLNTGKVYNLKSGNHVFWWVAKENRIGLDLK